MPMPVPFGSCGVPQFDFSATSFTTRRHARGVEAVAAALAAPGYDLVGEQVETELHRILPRRVRQLVDERLEHERERVAAGRAQRAGRHAERDLRIAEVEVLDEQRRELDCRAMFGRPLRSARPRRR